MKVVHNKNNTWQDELRGMGAEDMLEWVQEVIQEEKQKAVEEYQKSSGECKLGVIQFHSEALNPGIIKRFYEVTKDLRDSASIIDLWLMDIASVLKEFGYEMKIYGDKLRDLGQESRNNE